MHLDDSAVDLRYVIRGRGVDNILTLGRRTLRR